jgi:hypothetical protein
MLSWVLTFLVVALLAALCGFTGNAIASAAHDTGTKLQKRVAGRHLRAHRAFLPFRRRTRAAREPARESLH